MLVPCKDCEEYLEYKTKVAEINERQKAEAHNWMDFRGYEKAKFKRLGGKNE